MSIQKLRSTISYLEFQLMEAEDDRQRIPIGMSYYERESDNLIMSLKKRLRDSKRDLYILLHPVIEKNDG